MVISIIALLIGILLPALGSAREVARGSVCQANMRSVSTAFYSYAADNNMFIPGRSSLAGPTDAKNTARAWIVNGWLTDPFPADPIPNHSKDLSASAVWEYLGGGSGPSEPGVGPNAVLACPSDAFSERSSGVSYSGNSFLWDWEESGDPAVRAELGTVASAGGRGGLVVENSFLSLDVTKEPSGLIMLIDEGGPDDNAAVNPPYARGVNDGLFEFISLSPEDAKSGHNTAGDKSKWYHGDNAAFGFADGHGELRGKYDNEVTGFNTSVTFGDRSFRGYGKLWDPLAQAPADPTSVRSPGARGG